MTFRLASRMEKLRTSDIREILRVTDDVFTEGFGQCSHSMMFDGVAKAWHLHRKQTDWWYVVGGVLRVGLCDLREGSPTFRKTMDFLMGDHQPAQVLKIPPQMDAEAVAAAERSFAADAARLGTHAAFLAHLAADGLVFMPLPANGREIHGGRAEDGSLLSWGPSFVEVAASGDFAVSTGPWSWRAKGETAPAAFGHFLSLWVRREGRWQVRLDIGVSHPAQEEPPLRLSTLPASTRPAGATRPCARWTSAARTTRSWRRCSSRSARCSQSPPTSPVRSAAPSPGRRPRARSSFPW